MHSSDPGPARPSSNALTLRGVSQAQMRLSQRLDAGLTLPLDAAALPWTRMELTLAPGGTWSALATSPLRLQGRHGPIEFADASLLTVLTGAQALEGQDVGMTAGLQRMALARIPRALLDPLGGPFDLLASDQVDCNESPALHCLLTLTEINGESQTFLLQSGRSTLLRWSAQAQWQPHAIDWRSAPWRQTPLGRLSFSGGVLLARVGMPLRRLQRLRPGDAILIPPNDGQAPPALRILLGSALVNVCQRADDSYVFEGWVVEAPHLSNPSHVKAIEKGTATMDALKVDLDFIVGRLSMTVSELAAVAPGRILPLELATPPRVRIVAHGTELGTGELIDVDGRLAVEITGWGTRP